MDRPYEHYTYSVTISFDNKYLEVLDATTASTLWTKRLPLRTTFRFGTNCVAFSPDESLLAVAADRVLSVLDPEDENGFDFINNSTHYLYTP